MSSPNLQSGLGRLAATKEVVQSPTAADGQGYDQRDPFVVEAVELAGIRTLLGVPMLKEDELIGAIVIYRQEVRPFTRKADRVSKKLCRSGRHRYRERAVAR